MDPGGRVLFSTRGKCTLLNLYGIWYMVATLIVPSAEGDGDVCGDGDGDVCGDGDGELAYDGDDWEGGGCDRAGDK